MFLMKTTVVLPHFRSSPHKTLYPRGLPGHTEELYSWKDKAALDTSFCEWL